jgi:hypothetical protein
MGPILGFTMRDEISEEMLKQYQIKWLTTWN